MRFKKCLSLILIVCLLLLCSSSLIACHPKKNYDDELQKARLKTIDNLKSSVLVSTDTNWNSNLSEDKILLLENPGDYIVANEWANLLGDVFFESSLQTAKIENLINSIYTKEGKALFENFKENAKNLIPLFKNIGFISSDLQDLAFNCIKKLIDSSDIALENSLNKLYEINKNISSNNPNAIKNLKNSIANIKEAKIGVESLKNSKTELLQILENAKPSINALIEFGYKSTLSTISSDIIEKISSGALKNISNNELQTFLSGIKNNFEKFDKIITDSEQKEYLNKALLMIVQNLKSLTYTSAIFNQIIYYGQLAYNIVDYLPIINEFAINTFDNIDENFIEEAKNYFLNKDKIPQENNAIYLSKAISLMTKNTTKNDLIDTSNKFIESVYNDKNKNIAIMYFDLILNVIVFDGNGELNAKYLSEEDFNQIFNLILAHYNLLEFHDKYSDYQINGTTTDLYSTASTLIKFANIKVGNVKQLSKQWYELIVSKTEEALFEKAEAYKKVCKEDILKLVEYFYENQLIYINELKSHKLLSDKEDEETIEKFENLCVKSGVVNISMILNLFGMDIEIFN